MVHVTENDKNIINNFYKKTFLFLEIVKNFPIEIKLYIWEKFTNLHKLSSKTHDDIWRMMRQNNIEYKIRVCH